MHQGAPGPDESNGCGSAWAGAFPWARSASLRRRREENAVISPPARHYRSFSEVGVVPYRLPVQGHCRVPLLRPSGPPVRLPRPAFHESVTLMKASVRLTLALAPRLAGPGRRLTPAAQGRSAPWPARAGLIPGPAGPGAAPRVLPGSATAAPPCRAGSWFIGGSRIPGIFEPPDVGSVRANGALGYPER